MVWDPEQAPPDRFGSWEQREAARKGKEAARREQEAAEAKAAREAAHELQAAFDGTIGVSPALTRRAWTGAHSILRGMARGVPMPKGEPVRVALANLAGTHYELSQVRAGFDDYPNIALGVVLRDDDGALVLYSSFGHPVSRYRERRPLSEIGDAERANPWSALDEL